MKPYAYLLFNRFAFGCQFLVSVFLQRERACIVRNNIGTKNLVSNILNSQKSKAEFFIAIAVALCVASACVSRKSGELHLEGRPTERLAL